MHLKKGLMMGFISFLLIFSVVSAYGQETDVFISEPHDYLPEEYIEEYHEEYTAVLPEDIPEISQPACAEAWVCASWSECQEEGFQTRLCDDQNNCGTAEDKPEETRTCVYTRPGSGITGFFANPAATYMGVFFVWVVIVVVYWRSRI